MAASASTTLRLKTRVEYEVESGAWAGQTLWSSGGGDKVLPVRFVR